MVDQWEWFDRRSCNGNGGSQQQQQESAQSAPDIWGHHLRLMEIRDINYYQYTSRKTDQWVCIFGDTTV